MNNLSIVNIIDDENVFLINQLAEILGKGPNNIGIKLQMITVKYIGDAILGGLSNNILCLKILIY